MKNNKWLFFGMGCLCYIGIASAEPGVTDNTVRIGTVLALEGQAKGLGRDMKAGMEAAFKGQTVKGKKIKLIALNDSYEPKKTIASTNELLRKNIFIVAGNVGTPTAKVSLPILAKNNIPAVGFFTGAGLLRPGKGDIFNYRASYVQETANVINTALKSGLQPKNICAYVQNDAYGMAGIAGIKKALSDKPGTENIIATLDKILAMKGDNPARNNLGPVGVYTRNTLYSRPGYQSLKAWEKSQGLRCRLVVSVGAYSSIARFVAYSRYKEDEWLVSAVSFTGADNFKKELNEFGVESRVIMTQVVPELTSDLPILKEAQEILKDDYGYVTLEGYLVGKLVLKALDSIEGNLTRDNFIEAIRGNKIFLDGITLNFSDDNQGSDLVLLTYLDEEGYRSMNISDWN